jgi:predicted nucleic-acid-binding protein
MIGLDTNVLVRFLVKDDPRQAAKATAYIHEACSRDESLWLNHIVLCELVWVLESAYDHPKTAILDVMEKLLLTKQFQVERKDDVWAAIEQYRNGAGDFADHLLGRRNRSSGCEHTVTFDQSLKGSSLFRVL